MYTFANKTGVIPLSELDFNFSSVYNYVLTAGNVANSIQTNITQVGTLQNLAVAGNITAATISVLGTISSASNISTTGNVTASYILGNGSQLTGLPASYGNANVAAYLPTYTGNIGAGNISLSQNIVIGNTLSGLTISASGNITGNYFIGNGSQLTGIATGNSTAIVSGNSNVSVVSAGGNIATSVGGIANVIVVATTGQYVDGIISATGNVIANNFVGGGGGSPVVSSSTILNLSSPITVQVLGGGTFRLPSLTTANISNLTPANGDIIYNSSLNKFQGYENGAWGNLI
jgi:hypothetical protein